MEKKKKVIKYGIDEFEQLGVTAISFVEYPAIEVDFVAMSRQIKLSAINEEKRMAYGPVLIPDKEILRIDDEGNEYYIVFPPETIEKASQLFFKKNQHHNHTLEHAVSVLGCTVVESWIKTGESDKSVELGYDLPVGTWFVGSYVEDDNIWQEIKAGTYKGWSIEGMFAPMDQLELSLNKFLAEVRNILEK